MNNKKSTEQKVIKAILELYELDTAFSEQKEYISYNGENGDNLIKIILSVLLKNGQRVVIKLLHESDNLLKERETIEKQSEFSEFMRQNGIKTPKRYSANGNYCNEYVYNNIPCNVTVEDWCGEEIKLINTEIAYKIGELMARMHIISLKNECKIGCGTLFSAAYENDVDAFPQFCEICKNEKLDKNIVSQIKMLHDDKIKALREIWEQLPKAAVQGDVSVNNLVYGEKGLTVFDYNNAGDEVLVSDLVMEGLLTAYEMVLPEAAAKNSREELFPALLNGYLSIRRLSEVEAKAAWTIYTLYHSLWFTKIVYNDDSLEKLVKNEDFDLANTLLRHILSDMTEVNDGRFLKLTK